jgi:hypothetical protein
MNLFGGSLHPNFPDNRYIEYAEWIPIVKIVTNSSYCSGTIINSRFILTIKHAIEYQSKIEILFDGKILKYKNIIVHPKKDVCIIELQELIITNNLEFYEGVDLIGKMCVIGGYGISKKIGKDPRLDGHKRAGNNIVVWESSDLFECCMDGLDPVDLEFISTPGDSGGPVLINKQLVGINQYVKAEDNNPDSGDGDRSGHIKISSIKSWIDKHINS